MKGKSLYRLIILFILLVISYFYVYVTFLDVDWEMVDDSIYNFLLLMLPVIILVDIILFGKKRGRLLGVFKYLFLVICVIIGGIFIYNIIRDYLLFSVFDGDMLFYYYLIVVSVVFGVSIVNRNSNSTIYDNFILVFAIINILIFYRYYIDPYFIHNNYNVSKYDGHFNYINQYYLVFIMGYVVLLIGNKIEQVK